jgi:hypothetical protein
MVQVGISREIRGDKSRHQQRLAGCSVQRNGGGFRVPPYTDSMHIPHSQLSVAALWAVVEEFVTRDGTDHSAVECRIERVLRQLQAGLLELHFDVETRTCNILSAEENPFAVGSE